MYSSYFEPERLDDAQRRAIDAVMREAMPDAGHPWFVYVHYSEGVGGAEVFRVQPMYGDRKRHDHAREKVVTRRIKRF